MTHGNVLNVYVKLMHQICYWLQIAIELQKTTPVKVYDSKKLFFISVTFTYLHIATKLLTN